MARRRAQAGVDFWRPPQKNSPVNLSAAVELTKSEAASGRAWLAAGFRRPLACHSAGKGAASKRH